MIALRSLELLGETARPALPTIFAAQDSPNEFTSRIAKRLASALAP